MSIAFVRKSTESFVGDLMVIILGEVERKIAPATLRKETAHNQLLNYKASRSKMYLSSQPPP
jgi:hypothetical protein